MKKDNKSKTDRQASGKRPVYETPAIIILGELARGSGACGIGSGVTTGTCSNGPTLGDSCSVGVFAGTSCSTGPQN